MVLMKFMTNIKDTFALSCAVILGIISITMNDPQPLNMEEEIPQ